MNNKNYFNDMNMSELTGILNQYKYLTSQMSAALRFNELSDYQYSTDLIGSRRVQMSAALGFNELSDYQYSTDLIGSRRAQMSAALGFNELSEYQHSMDLIGSQIAQISAGMGGAVSAWQNNIGSISAILKSSVDAMNFNRILISSNLRSSVNEFNTLINDLNYNNNYSIKPVKVKQSRTDDLGHHMNDTEDSGEVVDNVNRNLMEMSNEDKQTIDTAIEDISYNDINWQKNFLRVIKDFSKTNPAVAWILAQIYAILLGILINIVSNTILTSKPSQLKESPIATSITIVNINVDQPVCVIGDEPYYYLVEFEDEQSQEKYRGYISKRSVKALEAEDRTQQ